MKQILVDTDILIDHLITKEKESILMKLMYKYDCFTTVINAFEVYLYAGRKNKPFIDMLLSGFKVLGLHGRYSQNLWEILLRVEDSNDWNLRNVLIVSLAVNNKLILATFNDENYRNFAKLKLLKINK